MCIRDRPAQYEVAAGAEGDEERTEDDEVDVEVCVFDVELSQDVVRLVKDTLPRVVVTAVERLPVKPVDRLQHTLERVPAHHTHNARSVRHGGGLN